MNRRKFVSFLALLAAGAAARPEQIAAFEKYYDANTPWLTDGGLIAVDELYIGGIATRSVPMTWKVYCSTNCVLNLGFNAFGGVLRWVAAPDQKLVTVPADFNWSLKASEGFDADPYSVIQGHILYIDQDGFRHSHILPGSGKGALVA